MKAWIRIPEAARLMGVSRWTARRHLRKYARRRKPGQPLLIPLEGLRAALAERAIEDLPIAPEMAEFREELDAMQNTIELLAEEVGRLRRNAASAPGRKR